VLDFVVAFSVPSLKVSAVAVANAVANAGVERCF